MLAAALATGAVAPGVLRLELRTDGHALVPPDDPAVVSDRAIREEFLTEDPIVILITTTHADGIFNAHTVALVQELTDELRALPGVRPEDVFSLATEHGHRVQTGTLLFRRLLEPLPVQPQELRQLRDDLRGIGLYNGTLVAYDEKSTAVMLGVPPGADRLRWLQLIRDLVRAKGELPEQMHIIGAPVAESLLGTHLLEDLGVPPRLLGYSTRAANELPAWRRPASLHELRELIGTRLGLAPVALVIMALVFLISFRSVAAMVLPLIEVGACLVFVFGLMGLAGVPIYLTIAVLPIILTVAGVADEVHIFAHYVDLLRQRPHLGRFDVLSATMGEMTSPVVKTAATTAIGFLSFAISPIRPVQAFGLFTAAGIVFCMLWSLTVIPAMLAVCPSRWFARGGAGDAGPRGESAAPGVAAEEPASQGGGAFPVVGRLRWVILAATAVALLAAPTAVRRVIIQDSWIDGFAPGSEFRRATDFFNRQFLGTHILHVCVDGGYGNIRAAVSAADVERDVVYLPGDVVNDPQALVGRRIRAERVDTHAPVLPPPWAPVTLTWHSWIERAEREGERIAARLVATRAPPPLALRLSGTESLEVELIREPMLIPEVLQDIAALEGFVERQTQDAVGGVVGTADYIETTYLLSRGLNQEYRRIPDLAERVEWLWSQYARIRGPHRLRQIVDQRYARSLVTIFLKNANFVDTANLMRKIRDYESVHLTPKGIRLSFAGDVAVSQTLIDSIVSTQTGSLLASFVGTLVVTTLLSRSLLWGALCLLPCALAVVVNFAVMGLVGMPLGVATSMFSAMVIGIGDDFAIHYVERYRLLRGRAVAHAAALRRAARTTGPAIVLDALAVGLGFGVMTLSQVPANARLGGLLVLSMASCLVGTLLVLPAILNVRRE